MAAQPRPPPRRERQPKGAPPPCRCSLGLGVKDDGRGHGVCHNCTLVVVFLSCEGIIHLPHRPEWQISCTLKASFENRKAEAQQLFDALKSLV